jgi:DNA polymerase-3 subunit delta'
MIGSADVDGSAFRLIARQAHPSVLHLTRPANDRTKGFKTVITVEEVRRVGRFLSMTSHDGGWRVVIVDPVDDLNTAAANALLKSLEEPPPRTVFLMIANQPGRLLPTIRSRCQLVSMSPLADAEVEAVFSGLGLGLPSDTTQRNTLLTRAAGSARTAILLSEYGGLEIAAAIDQVLEAPRFDVAAAAKIADAVAGRDREQQFGLFVAHLNTVLNSAASARAMTSDTYGADRVATAWAEFGRTTAETEIYNLDRRHFVASALMRVYGVLNA